DYETQESEGGEADLHKYLVGCKKNPGHKQFIPVDEFTLKHLPEGHHDKDLYDFIKVTAELTVRVDVKMSSPHRPEFWPQTTQPYPFYNMSGKRNLRTGSGSMWRVNKFQDGDCTDKDYEFTDYSECWCRKCQDSDSPSNVWWEFDVYSAAHVVFDDIEASYTILRLFYDKYDSPLVSVDKVSVVDVSIHYDVSQLKCVTCDKSIGNKLMSIVKHYRNVWHKIENKYITADSKHKINFIVSHPHGCSKQVSVGRWKEKHYVGVKSKFTYTTSTCPGSSGAHVQCVGYNYCYSDLVHSGSLQSGLNFSGASSVL
ncbi:hypothetical protein BgiMline_022225, partial [Biomphalaria glabrata]